jgi:two-component system, OmpR family, KDP operon response regulator KdpE
MSLSTVSKDRAAARGAQAPKDNANIILRAGDIELDAARRQVHEAGSPIDLTPKEFDLLHYLMAHAGLPITPGPRLNAAWGREYRDEVEYLRTYVCQPRKNSEHDSTAPKYLMTDIKIGYRFPENELEGQRPAARGTNSRD